MTNRLKNEASPYLQQHASNPVDWYPWCEEAFDKAREENRPVFLSIGYSTCHWCHVMAHESFENPQIAEILNRAFVCIKVDREERPDIDSVYMSVCQAFTGNGGWPMSIFMTWDKKPFFAGTYFPPRARGGAPGFAELLLAIEGQWNSQQRSLEQSAERITAVMKENIPLPAEKEERDIVQKGAELFASRYDEAYGGFGEAPKFPTPHNLLFLMLYARDRGDDHCLEMAEKTLRQMRKGGIYDQIGGGFSRYSTDRFFLAPHFEKMLYDNAWLIMAYCAAYSAAGNRLYLDTAEETAAYILREMTSDGGGFYSAQDADSEGVEGRFYTFSREEILSVLGQERGARFARAFDITEKGNFGGTNIPNLLKSGDLTSDFQAEKEALRIYRKSRAMLHLDDKILTAWNAMMIGAMAALYRVSKNEEYLNAAVKAQRFIDGSLCDGFRLYSSIRQGKRSGHAFLDDYAYQTAALLELYNSTLDCEYLNRAEGFCEEAVKRFADAENGGFFLSEGTELFMNPKPYYDGAVPSGNSMMAYNFVRLYQLTEKEKYRELLEKQISFLTRAAGSDPTGQGMLLLAKLLFDEPPKHVVFVWKEPADVQKARERVPFLANVTAVPESRERPLLNGRATCYICQGHTCLPPTNELTF